MGLPSLDASPTVKELQAEVYTMDLTTYLLLWAWKEMPRRRRKTSSPRTLPNPVPALACVPR